MVGPVLRIDPHVHSHASHDGHDPVELLLEHASEIGLDGIVVTDHDGIDASLRAAELAPAYGLVGIPGVEVSTAAGHLLAIGVERCPEPGRPLAETLDAVADQRGAAIVPHPFQRSRHGVRRRRLADVDPDAIEVYNSMLFTGYRNRRANAFARRRSLTPVAGSDAHHLPNVGRGYTEVILDADPDGNPAEASEAVVRAIRDGATGVTGRRTPIPASARHYAAGAARKATYALTSRAPFVPTWPAYGSDARSVR